MRIPIAMYFILAYFYVSNISMASVFPPLSILNEMQPKAESSESPNIILMNTDDVGYGDLGYYAATKLKTPNIERLAKDGRLFTGELSTSAVCTPSRYALLTGEYPFRINNYSPVFFESELIINTDKVAIASLLKCKGYATACIEKWHLGFGKIWKPDWNRELSPEPLGVGFDYLRYPSGQLASAVCIHGKLRRYWA